MAMMRIVTSTLQALHVCARLWVRMNPRQNHFMSLLANAHAIICFSFFVDHDLSTIAEIIVDNQGKRWRLVAAANNKRSTKKKATVGYCFSFRELCAEKSMLRFCVNLCQLPQINGNQHVNGMGVLVAAQRGTRTSAQPMNR